MIDLEAAVATYWSGMRVGVTDADIVAAASVCECVVLVGPVWNRTTHFLTVVSEESYGLNLGWALHTRTLDATWGDGWPNPYFGQEAVRNWSDFERLRHQA